jgi:hypothetical protein
VKLPAAIIAILICGAPPCLAQRSGTFGNAESWPAYDSGSPFLYPSLPVMLLVPAPESPPPPPAPAPPARPVVHEYRWPAPARDDRIAATFCVVLNDSTVRLAIAAWQQDGALHFLLPDGTAGFTPLDKIDREATLRLNAERGLALPLPETGSKH